MTTGSEIIYALAWPPPSGMTHIGSSIEVTSCDFASFARTHLYFGSLSGLPPTYLRWLDSIVALSNGADTSLRNESMEPNVDLIARFSAAFAVE